MTPPDGSTDAGAARGLEDTRQLLDELRRHLVQTLDDLDARISALPRATPPASPSYSRPLAAPPVRMEQLARTPEPTADLDDLVDVLAPRLLDRLVPALHEALRAEG